MGLTLSANQVRTPALGRRTADVPAAELGGPPSGCGRTTSSRRSSPPSTSPRTRCDSDNKVDVYREFFESASSWLRPGGRVGLQLICLDGVGEQASRLGQTAVGDLIGRDVFPESMPASLAEMVLGWETQFRLVAFLDSTRDYARTFRAWALAHRSRRAEAERLVGSEVDPALRPLLRGRGGLLPAARARAVPGRPRPSGRSRSGGR